MKLAIMQPYCFPYLGYYQLIHAVDKFIIYDDVNFIKQGWINRNRILVQRQPSLFVIPLKAASPFELIRETYIDVANYPRWCRKFLKTLEVNYCKSPYYPVIQPIIQRVLESILGQLQPSISSLALESLRAIAAYLDISTEFVASSKIYGTAALPPQEKLIQMYRAEGASLYINPAGGIDLFDREILAQAGVQLKFLQSQLPEYAQFQSPFVPGLSIIDVLMFNSVKEIQWMLNQYQLI